MSISFTCMSLLEPVNVRANSSKDFRYQAPGRIPVAHRRVPASGPICTPAAALVHSFSTARPTPAPCRAFIHATLHPCSLTIEWDWAPTDGGIPLPTYIQATAAAVDGGAATKLGQTSGSGQQELVTKPLTPGASYDVTLVATSVSSQARGGVARLRVTVRSEAPSTPPTLFGVSGVTDSAVDVKWGSPHTPNGRVLGYRLFYDGEPGVGAAGEGYHEVHLPPSCFSFRADNLDAGRMYRFQVLAFTAAGEGPHTPVLMQRTLGGAVSTNRWARRALEAEDVKLDDFSATVLPDGGGTSISGRAQPVSPQKPAVSTPATRPGPKKVFTLDRAQLKRPVTKWSERNRAAAAVPGSAATPDGGEDDRTAQDAGAVPDTGEGVEDLAEVPDGPPVVKVHSRGSVRKGFCFYPAEAAPGRGRSSSSPEAPKTERPAAKLRDEWSAATAYSTVKLNALGRAPGELGAHAAGEATRSGEREMLEAFDDFFVAGAEIRGRAGIVRKTLHVVTKPTFASQRLERLYEAERDSKIVLYTTSLESVRGPYAACVKALKLFDLLNVKVQVKDVCVPAPIPCARMGRLSARPPGTCGPTLAKSWRSACLGPRFRSASSGLSISARSTSSRR